MLDRRVEGERLLKKYFTMLQVGEEKLQVSRQESSLFDLTQDSSAPRTESAKSFHETVVTEINSLDK